MENLNETAQEILAMLGLDASSAASALNITSEANSKYLKDLKVNFKTALKTDNLSEKEAALIGIAIATNEKHEGLILYFKQLSLDSGANIEEIADSVACASLLSSNNVFYRFRHFTQKEKYSQIPARLRMNIMVNPVIGKEFFELVSLAVSAVNGCEMCVNAHESSLIELGSTEERIFDAVRLSAVIVSVSKIV
jgi:lipoyl-dependent peroxiredoxin subunit D